MVAGSVRGVDDTEGAPTGRGTRPTRVRLLLPGQYGPAFDDGGPLLVVEAEEWFTARPFHRTKAHVWLSALRHAVRRAGDRATHVRVATLREAIEGRDDLEVVDPPSRPLRQQVREAGVRVLPSRGFVTSEADFAGWVEQRRGRLLMGDFYEWVRRREGLLMEGPAPVGGRFSTDESNRERPPKGAVTLGLPDPWWPEPDDVDAEVRTDLDAWEATGRVRFVGADDRRRFAVTPDEAERALDDFLEARLGDFGPYEDAMLAGDWTMAHSMLSVPMNLGVLDPRHVVERVVHEFGSGGAPLQSVEGFVRQVVGWRDYVWHLYWHLGPTYATDHDALGATTPLPAWWLRLDVTDMRAACLGDVLGQVHDHGWVHHIPRLMVLGNWALQRGYRPAELTEWFTDVFVDGTDWVMPANIVGMSQHADGGIVATKPYASGGRYIDTMSDYCARCPFDPTKRLGDDACPYTAGYWAFLARTEPVLRHNPRMRNALGGLARLGDLDDVVQQEHERPGP
ncbi:cryptochrome/photolyase family protein [Frigoribacterium salinisoli]